MIGFASAGYMPRLTRFHTARQLISPSRRLMKTASTSITACAEANQEEVKRIAKLAQLELTDKEITKMTPEFQKVIDFFNEMNEMDIDDVEPMSTPNDSRNVMREDIPVRFNDVDSIISEAPSIERDFIRVPKIGSESAD